jgi:hypothetical protein
MQLRTAAHAPDPPHGIRSTAQRRVRRAAPNALHSAGCAAPRPIHRTAPDAPHRPAPDAAPDARPHDARRGALAVPHHCRPLRTAPRDPHPTMPRRRRAGSSFLFTASGDALFLPTAQGFGGASFLRTVPFLRDAPASRCGLATRPSPHFLYCGRTELLHHSRSDGGRRSVFLHRGRTSSAVPGMVVGGRAWCCEPEPRRFFGSTNERAVFRPDLPMITGSGDHRGAQGCAEVNLRDSRTSCYTSESVVDDRL